MIDTTHTVNPEWHNENALRAYPLADDCPASAVLPPWLLADLRVTADRRYTRVFLSSAYVSPALVSIGISGQEGDAAPVGLLVRTVTRDELEPGRAYALERVDGKACGTVVFGTIPSDAAGFKLNFGATEATFAEAAVLRAAAPGVEALVDAEHGLRASGIIDLSGNAEFRTARDPADPQTVIITLDDLYRDLTTSVCSSAPSFERCGMTPVKSINGVAPDADGLLTLRFR